MEYLGKTLPRTAQIVVDADKKEDTIQIFEKVMSGRCRFERMRAADSLFGRGAFSPEVDEYGLNNPRDIFCDFAQVCDDSDDDSD